MASLETQKEEWIDVYGHDVLANVNIEFDIVEDETGTFCIIEKLTPECDAEIISEIASEKSLTLNDIIQYIVNKLLEKSHDYWQEICIVDAAKQKQLAKEERTMRNLDI